MKVMRFTDDELRWVRRALAVMRLAAHFAGHIKESKQWAAIEDRVNKKIRG